MNEKLSGEKRKLLEKIKVISAENPVMCIVGYVKCGKTTLMKELEKELCGEYIDAKTLNEDKAFALYHTICDSLKKSDGKTYLIDNFPDLKYCDEFLNSVSYALDEIDKTSSRVILCGNSRIMISLVNRFYFIDNFECISVTSDYMSFSEWKEFNEKGSERDYFESIANLHGIVDFRAFLGQCIDNSRSADKNALNVLYNNENILLSVEFLLDAIYSAMYLGGQTDNSDLFDAQDKMLVKTACERFLKCSDYAFREALIFLYVNGIVSIWDNEDTEKSTASRLMDSWQSRGNDFKDGYFREYTISFRHPVFLSAILKQMNYQKRFEQNIIRSYFMANSENLCDREDLFYSADEVIGGYAMWFDFDAEKPKINVVYLDNPEFTAVIGIKWEHFEEISFNMPRENLFELKFLVERNKALLINEWNEKKASNK